MGALLRVIPMVLWPMLECVRDECIYRSIAYKIVGGNGLTTASKGWLPAPGTPYLLAIGKVATGSFQSVKWVHIVLSEVSIALMFLLGSRVGESRRVARIAAWLFAINPTIAWFTNTLWIETIYIFLLLLATLMLLESKHKPWTWAVLSGAALGCAVLFRGMATYLPPFFLIGAMYPTSMTWDGVLDGIRGGWRHAVGFMVGLLIIVSPYSVYGTQKHGAFMVSDATSGHVLYLGNNDYPPLTFDYGNGMLTQPLFQRYLRIGRKPCPRKQSPVVAMECESDAAREWIEANPGEFLSRVPQRTAQLVNPHSFLTRHIRWGYFKGIPWALKEFLVVYTAAFSSMLMLGGTLGLWARGRGPFGVIASGTIVYTFATIALVYGMTRFRLPIEPLWTIYLAILIADWHGTTQSLGSSLPRQVGALLTLPALFALMLWYLPTGWPLFW
jgi:4-amino-4-deoxy-L-arabinose transferase-like glycosyltransferase